VIAAAKQADKDQNKTNQAYQQLYGTDYSAPMRSCNRGRWAVIKMVSASGWEEGCHYERACRRTRSRCATGCSIASVRRHHRWSRMPHLDVVNVRSLGTHPVRAFARRAASFDTNIGNIQDNLAADVSTLQNGPSCSVYSANKFSTGRFRISPRHSSASAARPASRGGTNSTEVKKHHGEVVTKGGRSQDAVVQRIRGGAAAGKLENALSRR